MRFMGHNALAIFVAALAIYLIEFVIFAVLMSPEQYQGMSGYAASADGAARMPWGIAPPILAAIGLSLAIKWRDRPGWMSGALTGVMMAIFFGVGVSLYSYVYGPNTGAFVGIDVAHFAVCYAVAGAILGAWK